MFESLVGDPKVLFYDLLDNPDKYEPAAAELIQLMIAGKKNLPDLDEAELRLLDRAVVDYNRAPTPRPTSTTPKQDTRPVLPKAEKETPPPMVDGAPAFWWL